ncbi:P1 family peptidase [Maritalea sp.]|uniref:P1 family peptidase n=1 Tax=Maritalea sp. TaxID=2003361 RepID=UPI003EF32B19
MRDPEFENLTSGWWRLPTGPTNMISDVAGVRVGHCTKNDGSARTGVTAVLPHSGNMFSQKLEAGVAVLNGFGKSVGLVQVKELGQIETPILLSNTFAMPTCSTVLTKRAIAQNPEIGRKLPTVNPLAFECNDGLLNDIQALHVSEDMAQAALDSAAAEFELGSVGAGTGMKSFGFAGGVGSASRLVQIGDDLQYTIGALVLSNFGKQSEFRFCGKRLLETNGENETPDRGSIIILLATNAPLCSRQLKRVASRSSAALGRMGSFLGHGSGDIALAFSTANQAQTNVGKATVQFERLNESLLDQMFLGAVEAVEEAVLTAMWHGKSREGYDGIAFPELRNSMLNDKE